MQSLWLSLLLVSPTWAISDSINLPSVTLSAGVVQGAECSNGAAAYLNIPFAQPPIGALRFTSPQAYNESYPSGTLNATTPGPACIQFGDSAFVESGPASEDCLHLDVWVPPNANKSSALPVKIWIYGGGEQDGGISNALYNGCNVAADGAILVSINYRLGSLGFLALYSAGIDGNFGIQDILLGLQWVQSNIAAFGGDTKKVVLFGQSAGATNVFIISTLPQAKSLVSAVISESGGGRDLAPSSVLQNISASYAASLNCSVTDASCLRSKTTTELNVTNPSIPGTIIYSGINPSNFQPYIDGKTIPAQPSTVGTTVPMIFGSNTAEGAIFVLAQYGLGVQSLTQANYTAFLQDNFGSYAPQVEKQYPLSAFGSGGVAAAMTEIITDASYFCPAHRALNVAVQNNVPVWTYLYNHTSSCSWFGFLPAIFINDLGATHTAEIPYVFGNVDFLPLPNGTCNMTSTERDISSTLISAWTAMAVNGNPSVDGGLQWPAFNSSSLGLNILNGTTVGTVDYSQCSFWDTVDTTVLNFTATTTNSTPASPSTTSSSVSSPSPSKNAASHSMAHPGSAFGLAAFVVYFGMLALL